MLSREAMPIASKLSTTATQEGIASAAQRRCGKARWARHRLRVLAPQQPQQRPATPTKLFIVIEVMAARIGQETPSLENLAEVMLFLLAGAAMVTGQAVGWTAD